MVIILLISIVLVIGASIRGIFSRRYLSHLASSYKTERYENFVSNFNQSFELNRIFSRDYSVWDEMVVAVEKGDKAWFVENIDPAFDTFDTSAAWVLDDKFSLKYSATKEDHVKNFTLPFDFKKESKDLFKDGYFVEIFTTYEEQVYHVSIAPIQPSDDEERQSKPRGYLVTAKQMNGDFINRLEKDNQVSIKVLNANQSDAMNDLDQGSVGFTYLLNDWQGKHTASLNITAQSSFLKTLYSNENGQYWMLIQGIILSLVVYGCVIYIMVSRPLWNVSDAIRYGGGRHLHRINKRQDEIGEIARLVEKNIAQNEQLKASYEHIEKAEKQASQHLAEAQKINGLMVGRELRMTELKKENERLRRQLKGEQKDGK